MCKYCENSSFSDKFKDGASFQISYDKLHGSIK